MNGLDERAMPDGPEDTTAPPKDIPEASRTRLNHGRLSYEHIGKLFVLRSIRNKTMLVIALIRFRYWADVCTETIELLRLTRIISKRPLHHQCTDDLRCKALNRANLYTTCFAT
jgi:hypothetical protein